MIDSAQQVLILSEFLSIIYFDTFVSLDLGSVSKLIKLLLSAGGKKLFLNPLNLIDGSQSGPHYSEVYGNKNVKLSPRESFPHIIYDPHLAALITSWACAQ